MHWIDHGIIAVYFLGMMGVGVYFLLKQGDIDAYFVGSRKMTAGHIGLSVVATDVGYIQFGSQAIRRYAED